MGVYNKPSKKIEQACSIFLEVCERSTLEPLRYEMDGKSEH